jgi:hypothetical protein
MRRVPFTFRRQRKTMRGGLDPVEMQRRSAEARKRKRTQDSLAGRLERVALEMVSNPATPAHVRERLLARLARSSSAESDVDVGTSEVRGVSLQSIIEGTEQAHDHTHKRRHGDGGGPAPLNDSSTRAARDPLARSGSEAGKESSGGDFFVNNVGRVEELPRGRFPSGTPLRQAGGVISWQEEREFRNRPEADFAPPYAWTEGDFN